MLKKVLPPQAEIFGLSNIRNMIFQWFSNNPDAKSWKKNVSGENPDFRNNGREKRLTDRCVGRLRMLELRGVWQIGFSVVTLPVSGQEAAVQRQRSSFLILVPQSPPDSTEIPSRPPLPRTDRRKA